MNFYQNSQLYLKNKSNFATCVSHIGKRHNYEDNFLFDGKHIDVDLQKQMPSKKSIFLTSHFKRRVSFFAISDGMGGHNAGEVASKICVEKLAELEKTVQNCLSIKEVVYLAQATIAEINSTVCEMSYKQKDLRGMGSTLVLLIICGEEIAILNIGDSRAYKFDGYSIIQLTKDNTEGQRMLDLELLTSEEIKSFPARKNLTRYIGYGEAGFILKADEYYPIINNEMILLCSDGVTDALNEYEMKNILSKELDMGVSGKMLIEQAIAVDNADNATAILVNIER